MVSINSYQRNLFNIESKLDTHFLSVSGNCHKMVGKVCIIHTINNIFCLNSTFFKCCIIILNTPHNFYTPSINKTAGSILPALELLPLDWLLRNTWLMSCHFCFSGLFCLGRNEITYSLSFHRLFTFIFMNYLCSRKTFIVKIRLWLRGTIKLLSWSEECVTSILLMFSHNIAPHYVLMIITSPILVKHNYLDISWIYII